MPPVDRAAGAPNAPANGSQLIHELSSKLPTIILPVVDFATARRLFDGDPTKIRVSARSIRWNTAKANRSSSCSAERTLENRVWKSGISAELGWQAASLPNEAGSFTSFGAVRRDDIGDPKSFASSACALTGLQRRRVTFFRRCAKNAGSQLVRDPKWPAR